MTDRIPFFKSTQTGGVARAFQPRLEEYISVKDFGAKGDGATDDTAAIQSAINYANSIGGGAVMFPPALYYTTGTLSLKRNVALCGVGDGPYDTAGPTNPLTTCCGPTLLVTSTAGPFIDQPGTGVGCNQISDLIFGYPSQVSPTTSPPTVYPVTIRIKQGATHVERCLFINPYDAIAVQTVSGTAPGRVVINNCNIGAIHTGIIIDGAQDYIGLSNILWEPYYDYAPNLSFPQGVGSLDVWRQTNGVNLQCLRCDAIEAVNLMMFGNFSAGIAFDDSSLVTPKTTYGNFSNVDIDMYAGQYGINCKSVRVSGGGVHFANLNVGLGTVNGGTVGIWLPAGGSETPLMTVNGGAIRGTWTTGYTLVAAGTLWVQNVYQLDLPGGAVTTPGFPASGTPVTNTFPYTVQICMNGGTVSDVQINGSSSGGTRGLLLLKPNQTVTVIYTVAPTWTWFTA